MAAGADGGVNGGSVNETASSIADTDRDVERRPILGQEEGHAAVLRRTYDVPIERLWEVLTSPAELETWFLPVSGDLRAGGTFQFEGNAGGDILECEEPRLVRATWVYGDNPANEIVLRLSPEGDNRTALELEHAAPVDEDGAPEFVLGVGAGWDPALVGLDMYLRGELPEDKEAFAMSPEVMDMVRSSVGAWTEVLKERGVGSPDVVDKKAEESLAFYTGESPGG
jgi:uncharacterized protein YndB with AHSA1/START domain